MAEENTNNALPPADMNFPQPGDLPGGQLAPQSSSLDNSISPDQFQMEKPVRPLSYREQAQARQMYQKQMEASPTFNPSMPSLPQPDVGFPTLDQSLPTRGNVLNMLDNNFATIDQRVDQDALAFGKATMFNSNNPSNMGQFKQRYQEHGEFENLGFSPFRDNEKLYNANSSWTSDLMRAGGQWAELTGLAMVDMTGFGPQSDAEIAKKQEDLFAIGSSTRGGVGGFATNFFLNSGTTVGILAELAVEELILGATEAALGIGTAASGGALAPLTVPVMGGLGARMGIQAGRAGNKLYRGWKMAKNLRKTLDNMKDFSKFRNFANKAGKFVNPIDNTTDFFRTLNKGQDYADFSGVQKVAKGLSAGYSDMRNIRLTWSEAAMEGGGAQNAIADKMLNEWEMANPGKQLSEEEARKMMSFAEKAGSDAAWYNMPAIFFTNKLMFNGLVSGRFRGAGQRLMTADGKKVLFNPNKAFGSNYKLAARRWGKRQINKITNPKQTLRDMAQSGALYGEANFGEGFQEIAQESIAAAAEEMAMEQYGGNLTRGGLYNYLGSGLQSQISPTGVETFLSGFLMGGFISPISGAISNFTQGRSQANSMETGVQYGVRKVQDVFARTRAIIGGANSPGAKQVAQRRKAREDADLKYEQDGQKDVEMLNQYYEDPIKYLSPHIDNLEVQQQTAKAMRDAEDNNDKKGYQDAKDASVNNHLLTAIRYGTTDTVIERLKDIAENVPEENFKTDYNISKQEFTNQVEKFTKKAQEIKDLWQAGTEVLGTNPWSNPEYLREMASKSPQAAKQAMLNKMAWDGAMQELVFNQAEFRDALGRKESILEKAKDNVGLKNTSYNDFNLIFSTDALQAEKILLTEELASFGTPLEKAQKDYIAGRTKRKETVEALIESISAMNTDLNKDDAETLSDETFNSVKDAYTGYVKAIAEKNGDYVSQADIERGVVDFIDTYALEGRTRRMMTKIDTLLNPTGFKDAVERISTSYEQRMANKKEEIKRALTEFRKVKDLNESLNKLYEAGMFLDPKDLDALKKEGTIPKNIYYVTVQPDGSRAVYTKSEDYKTALKILQEYSDKTLTGIPIAEADPSLDEGFTAKARAPEANDKRTYDDLIKQFVGENANTDQEEFKVPLPQVLQAVVDSKYSTPNEKILAAKMLETASDVETVTFSRTLPRPGIYSNERQTVIDPRYSASNFEGGKVAIEYIIMHEEMHRRTINGLVEDPMFKQEIKGLLDNAKGVWESLSTEEKQGYTTDGNPFYGLKNESEFIAELFSNENFQNWLATVPSQANNSNSKSTWNAFIDAVIERIRKIFKGVGVDNSVLNAALDITSTYMDKTLGLTPESIQTESTNQTPVSSSITLAEFNTWSATNRLSKRQIALLALKDKNNEELNQYEKQILENESASNLVAEYQKAIDSKKEIKPNQRVVDPQDREELKALGYTDREITNLKAKMARAYANEALTKIERSRLESPQETNDNIQKATEYKDAVDSLWGNITNFNEWQNANDQFETLLTSYDLYIRKLSGVTSEYIESLKASTLEKLQKEVTFDTIKEGEFVVIQTNSGMAVIEITKKTAKQLRYRFQGSDKILRMNASTVPNTVVMRYVEGIESIQEENIELTEEQKEFVKETNEAAEKAAKAEGAAKKYVESDKSIEELQQEIIKKICK